jgi:hypothetical protein
MRRQDIGLKRQVGNGLLPVSSWIRSTFVGYPLHSYLQLNLCKNIRECWLQCDVTTVIGNPSLTL